MTADVLALALIGAIGLGLALWGTRALARRAQSAERVRAPLERPPEEPPPSGSALARWLELAGLRGPGAVTLFLVASALSIGLGLLVVAALDRSAILARQTEWLESAPGGIGQVFLPVVHAAPWVALVALCLLPVLFVRARRRQRVAAIERDLPLVLELLATLAQAGLSFDAALARILESLPATRPLSAELRAFQVELVAGTSRVTSLRRLAERIGLASVSVFVSALVQAEQVGAGIADVLRRQADDLRQRRRERVAVLAQALSVKLVFPLVLCFLPMIFVATLGPAFHQFFELADNVTRNLR